MKNPRIIKVILISLFFGAFTQKVFCIGAGIQIGCSPSLEFTNDGKLDFSLLHNVTGTLKLSKLPMTLGAGISLRTSNAYDSPFLGFSAFTDYYILDIQLKNIWSLYSGLGLSGNLLFNTKLKVKWIQIWQKMEL